MNEQANENFQRTAMDWITGRQSLFPKSFTPVALSDSMIEAIVEPARWAPTHKLTQPWRFVAIAGPVKERMVQIQQSTVSGVDPVANEDKKKKFDYNAQQSAVILAIVMCRDEAQRVPAWEEMCAVACAVQNIHINLRSLSLGGFWSTGAGTNSPAVRAWLNLQPDDVHMGWFYIGGLPENYERRTTRLHVASYLEVMELGHGTV